MNKIINLCTVAILFLSAPLYAANKLPTGATLSYAMTYYNQHVLAGKSCPTTVAINARNKSAILKSAMPGYAAATVSVRKPSHFADYFSAVVQTPHRCQSPLSGLPDALVANVSKAVKIPRSPTSQNTCPDLEKNQKQAFELYLEALAAKAVWDIVNKQC